MDNESTLEEQIKEELEHIDNKIAEHKDQIELAEAIERLHTNDDFKTVILDGYMETEAERIFSLLITPMGWKKEINDTLLEKIAAIRSLKEFIGVKLREAITLPETIVELEDYRKEVTARGSEDSTTKE